MRKNAIRTTEDQERVPPQRTLRLASVIRESLYEFVIREGMKALDAMLEEDRERLCGPAYTRAGADAPVRWGTTHGRLVMAGRRIMARKPRVRQNGKEVTLPTWAQFADEDPLSERTMEQMVVGVSTRNYDRSLEELPTELGGHGASKSAASRRFVELTQDKLDAWLNRDLTSIDIVSVMIDGIEVGDHTVIVALGITASGEKQPLGVWEGATENSVVCGELLSNLISRGLDASKKYLFVIDGSKALRKAIRELFGKRGLVQRCQEHKRRNVIGHLPKRLQPSVSRMIRDAYACSSKAPAQKRLMQLIAQLDSEYPDAAASLREGLDETLTLKDLKLPKWLERTLSTTNPIENLNGAIRRITGNVKRWRNGAMIRRWVATAVLEAQRGFRRLRGYQGMSVLVAALRTHAEQTNRIDDDQAAA